MIWKKTGGALALALALTEYAAATHSGHAARHHMHFYHGRAATTSSSSVSSPASSSLSSGTSTLVESPTTTLVINTSTTTKSSTLSTSGASAVSSGTTSNSVSGTSTASGTTTATGSIPSATEPTQNLQLLYDRQLPFIITGVTGLSNIPTWLASQQPDGTWADVNYGTGCDAQRANWPAQQHWNRINSFAAAYHGASSFNSKTRAYVHDPAVKTAIDNAMNWWFERDFTNIACLDNGGGDQCPCGTPGLWNTNWFSNIILIPRLVTQACLMLLQSPIQPSLTPTQYSNCTNFGQRAFATFTYPTVGGLGTITGANTLDIASVGIAYGLLAGDEGVVSSGYDKVHAEVQVQSQIRSDGIRNDGSFAQHRGVLYDGNYGKDYANDVLQLEIPAAGTQWSADNSSRTAFVKHVDGFQWMVVRNVLTNVLHWDLSAVGRMIMFAVSDNQATQNLKMNITEIDVLGQQWDVPELSEIVNRLNQNTTDANAGELKGNRMFWDTDYMVHRGDGYVTSLKMYSSRTTNTECVNSGNTKGFHLSDGTVYTYVQGGEYEDIAASWDWNLIPGITVDYGATPFACGTTQQGGIEAFVGGASDGDVGVAAMRYTNPITKSLSWQKAWFFLENNVQYVMVSKLASGSNATVLNVLDQKRHNGDVFVDGATANQGGIFPGAKSLWHGNVGYVFDHPTADGGEAQTLVVSLGPKTGDWSAIGTSTAPPTTVDLFAASMQPVSPSVDQRLSYAVYPARSHDDFAVNYAPQSQQQHRSTRAPVPVRNDGDVSAVYDPNPHTRTAGIVFWNAAGGSVNIPLGGRIGFSSKSLSLVVTSDQAVSLIVCLNKWQVTVADPAQVLSDVTLGFSLMFDNGRRDVDDDGDESDAEYDEMVKTIQAQFGRKGQKKVKVSFPPADGLRGQSVTRSLSS